MANLHPSHSDHSEPTHPQHETSDVNVRAILGFGLGLIVVAAVTYGIVLGFYSYLSRTADRESSTRLYPLAAGQDDRLPPEPRLQTNPREDLSDLRRDERELLDGYHWVDKNAGVVRIPIEDAMRLTIQRGLPSRPSAETNPPADGAR